MYEIFKGFELYTSQPQLKPTYYLAGETEQHYRARQRVRQKAEVARNRQRNQGPITWKSSTSAKVASTR